MDEKQIIENVVSGRKEDFGFIVDKYKDYVFSICLNILKNRDDAEDASQDVFYKAYKKLKVFDHSSKFSTWLYRIAYNSCIDIHRKNQTKQKYFGYIGLNTKREVEQEHSFDNELINVLLSELKEEDRAIITLFYLNELTIEEIAKVTEKNPDTIKVKLHRIRKKLKKISKEIFNDEIENNLNG